MPYINYIVSQPNPIRFTNQQLLDIIIGTETNPNVHSKGYFKIRTMHSDNIVPNNIFTSNMQRLLQDLPPKSYLTFNIPKASGGVRRIEAPTDAYKIRLKEISLLLSRVRVLPHQAAFAYTTGRCAYDSLVVHQSANARWFYKADLKDFFPSITKQVLIDKLPLVYPFNLLSIHEIEQLADFSVNEKGVLPQGSPLSPLFSNLIMLEFDIKLTEELRNFHKQHYTYTRYADDLLITSAYDFKFSRLTSLIRETLKECGLPIFINKDKIRYGSMAGRNWNVGLMYNKDQKITVGHAYKKDVSFLLNLLLRKFKAEEPIEKEDVYQLVGKIGYIKNIEPLYYDRMVAKYERKYQVSYKQMVRTVLNNQ